LLILGAFNRESVGQPAPPYLVDNAGDGVNDLTGVNERLGEAAQVEFESKV
jgi:hypothetical protein